MAARGDRRGADLVHELFGVNLQEQGRGFYAVLEFLAICQGVIDLGEYPLFHRGDGLVKYSRRSHDLARRLAVGAEIDENVLDAAVRGEATKETLRALLASLVVVIPGRRAAPNWRRVHFYPFVGELIHYDAVERLQTIKIERNAYRDGGGLIYKIVRSDPDAERWARLRVNVADLVRDSDTALGRVAGALSSHDQAPKSPFEDESERAADPKEQVSPWPEILRSGLDRITRRVESPPARRIDQLLHWLPYCLARHQLRLAREHLGHESDLFLADATSQANPIRTRSQKSLQEFRTNIGAALRDVAALHKAGDPDAAATWDKYARHDSRFTQSPQAFFSETLAAVGALNATTGRRHFVLKPPLLEAVVAGTLEPGQEMEYEAYCELLAAKLGLIIGPAQARSEGLTADIDEAVFSMNAAAFRSRLETAGLLTRYSDATDLVHAEMGQ